MTLMIANRMILQYGRLLAKTLPKQGTSGPDMLTRVINPHRERNPNDNSKPCKQRVAPSVPEGCKHLFRKERKNKSKERPENLIVLTTNQYAYKNETYNIQKRLRLHSHRKQRHLQDTTG